MCTKWQKLVEIFVVMTMAMDAFADVAAKAGCAYDLFAHASEPILRYGSLEQVGVETILRLQKKTQRQRDLSGWQVQSFHSAMATLRELMREPLHVWLWSESVTVKVFYSYTYVIKIVTVRVFRDCIGWQVTVLSLSCWISFLFFRMAAKSQPKVDREQAASLIETRVQGPTKRHSRGGASYTMRQLFESWCHWHSAVVRVLLTMPHILECWWMGGCFNSMADKWPSVPRSEESLVSQWLNVFLDMCPCHLSQRSSWHWGCRFGVSIGWELCCRRLFIWSLGILLLIWRPPAGMVYHLITNLLAAQVPPLCLVLASSWIFFWCWPGSVSGEGGWHIHILILIQFPIHSVFSPVCINNLVCGFHSPLVNNLVCFHSHSLSHSPIWICSQIQILTQSLMLRLLIRSLTTEEGNQGLSALVPLLVFRRSCGATVRCECQVSVKHVNVNVFSFCIFYLLPLFSCHVKVLQYLNLNFPFCISSPQPLPNCPRIWCIHAGQGLLHSGGVLH